MRKKNTLFLSLLSAGLIFSTAGPASAEGALNLFNWSNYFSPDLIEKFQAETGIEVTLDTYASDEEMLSKVQAGGSGYDIVFPSGTTVIAMSEQGLLAEVDAKSMANFKNVPAPFDAPVEDPERMHTVPYMWGTTGISYHPAMIAKALGLPDYVEGALLTDSWSWFFEPSPELAAAGIAALDDQRDLYYAAAYYLGFDKCTESQDEAQKILDLLLKQKEQLKLYSSEGTIDRMIAGEVAIHMQWNGAAHRVWREKPDRVYVYPEEGTTFWSDHLAVLADAPNMENAKIFLNFMMDPENAAMAANYTGYSTPIMGAGDYLLPDMKADAAVNMPAAYGDRLVGFKACSTAAVELRDKVWTRLKS